MPSQNPSYTIAKLNYLADSPLYKLEKPYELILPELPEGLPQTNLTFTTHSIALHDMRTTSTEFGLDITGFMPVKHVSSCQPSFENLEQGNQTEILPFLEETRALAQRTLKAVRIVVSNWIYRENSPHKHDKEHVTFRYEEFTDGGKNPQNKGPSSLQYVHSDFSFASGIRDVRLSLTADEQEKYINSRHRIRVVNVWRPLIETVTDAPLAWLDCRSTRRSDFVPNDCVMPDTVRENAMVQYRPEHQWYWLSRQTRSEPVLFTTWDSRDGAINNEKVPGVVAHSAFQNPHAEEGAPFRRSIEVRLIVITEES